MDNAARANIGRMLVEAYRERTGAYDDAETVVADLMADLFHYLRAEAGIGSWNSAVNRALRCFENEVEEEAEEQRGKR